MACNAYHCHLNHRLAPRLGGPGLAPRDPREPRHAGVGQQRPVAPPAGTGVNTVTTFTSEATSLTSITGHVTSFGQFIYFVCNIYSTASVITPSNIVLDRLIIPICMSVPRHYVTFLILREKGRGEAGA